MTEPCEHQLDIRNHKRQLARRYTLLIADCVLCGTTKTVAIVEQTADEAAKMQAIVERRARSND